MSGRTLRPNLIHNWGEMPFTSDDVTARQRVGPHYWDEDTFSAQVRRSGFSVLEMRRTFLGDASLLVWARKNAEN